MAKVMSAALEDYLEAIAELTREQPGARVRDIAARVGVHKSTVTAALHSLSDKGLVDYRPYAAATLSAAGRVLADEIRRRHRILRRFFRDVLGLDAATADANACRLEHAIGGRCLERLLAFLQFIESTGGSAEVPREFASFLQTRGLAGTPAAEGG